MEKLLLSISKNDLRTYGKIQKIAASQRDDYTADCLLDNPFFKERKL